MSTNLAKINEYSLNNSHDEIEILTMNFGKQLLGIPVKKVRDVIVQTELTKVPLVPKQVIGLINLRGRIVTAVDLRAILDMPEEFDFKKSMSVVVEYKNDLYSLVVDGMGEVIKISPQNIIQNPENLSENWLKVSMGIYPIEHGLIVIVDTNKLLSCMDG